MQKKTHEERASTENVSTCGRHPGAAAMRCGMERGIIGVPVLRWAHSERSKTNCDGLCPKRQTGIAV